MPEAQMKLTGGPAIVVIVLLTAFAVFRYSTMKSTLSTEAAEVLKTWLSARYAAAELDRIEASGNGLPTPEQTDALLRTAQVEIASVSARGSRDDIVVRAEIRVAGGPPPDGQSVRYYHMTHSLATGWRLKRETWKWAYYLKLL